MIHFGLQRDELLYITLGDHPAWGYKEAGPLIAFFSRLTNLLFPDALFAPRLFSTAFSALLVFYTGRITLELGGSKFALTLACLAVLLSPGFEASGYLFEPVVFDQFWWTISIYVLIRYLKTSRTGYLYQLGFVLGIGLLTKASIGFFAVAILAALIVPGKAYLFYKKHFLYAIVIMLVIIFPNVVWQISHRLPLFTQMKDLRSQQLVRITPVYFALQQLLIHGAAVIIWLLGLYFLAISPFMLRFRFLALTYLFSFLIFMSLHGKDYYMLGAYPMLFAAGGVFIERKFKNFLPGRIGAILLLLIPNLVLLPLFLPVFSLDATKAIFQDLTAEFPCLAFEGRWDDNQLHPVPQNYGTMIGWDELAAKVYYAYAALPQARRKRTVIMADNYGEASSLHVYGKQLHLPEVISLSSSFSLWAPGRINADYIILVTNRHHEPGSGHKSGAEGYSKIGEIKNPLAVEQGTGIYLLTKPGRGFYSRYSQACSSARSR
ncbi:MAG: glycosyltransferase family 39 protein [Mucilaginibacter sp.]|nr:glycosyltransferase family 39 protein [Mucilaginibacter sp.]